jgi:glycosyltransferase involved in cell wall biosynthesis
MAIKQIDCKLLIVGKLIGEQIELLKENQTDFENYVNLSESTMFELYQRCDILMYVSSYEGFGMPVIEANVVGRPVIASNIEPINSVAGNAALLVDPYNTDEIKKAISFLLQDMDYCRQLVENGFENAKKYHPALIARKYMDIYEEMVREK